MKNFKSIIVQILVICITCGLFASQFAVYAENQMKKDNQFEDIIESKCNCNTARKKSNNEPSRAELDKVIADAENFDIGVFTEVGQAAFADALATAKYVQADKNATQDIIDVAAKRLKEMMDGVLHLIPVHFEDDEPSRAELDKVIADAENFDIGVFTEDGQAAFADALATAKYVQADKNATQDIIDVAAKRLKEMMDIVLYPMTVHFEDVKNEKAFFFKPVYWAYGHEPQITKGVDDTHFGPDQGCTRGQVVTFLWRAAGCPEPTKTENPFTDVKEGAFYYKAVLWAVENSVTKGTTETTFAPDATCTRGQIVTFLYRAKGSPELTKKENPFKDVANGQYYAEAVAWAVENNVTKGKSADTFAPNATCTRGEVVTFLYRAMGEK